MALRLFTVGIAWWHLEMLLLLLLLLGFNNPLQSANAFRSSSLGLPNERSRQVLPRQHRGVPCACVDSSKKTVLRRHHKHTGGYSPPPTRLSCGLLEALQNAFGGGSAAKAKAATASHILINGGPESNAETKLLQLKKEIGEDPVKFGELAARYSDCSSASAGGDLGEFEPGKMVREFDDVVFDPKTPIGEVQGPIRTEFGYHLILVKERIE